MRVINCEPPINPPEPEFYPECPECGSEAETFYEADGKIIGCENCVSRLDAWEWAAEQKEVKQAELEDRQYDEWIDRNLLKELEVS